MKPVTISERVAAFLPRLGIAFFLSAVLLVIAIAVGGYDSRIIEREATVMFINVVLVIGIYSFSGLSGILSFGHASFMAIGAYVTALVTIPVAMKVSLLPDLPGFLGSAEFSAMPAIAAAALVCLVFAAIVAIPIMRLSGGAATIATFALLLIVHTVSSNWEQVTRGRLTMISVPVNTTLISALVGAIIAITIVALFQSSRTGLRLRASREDEYAAQALGINLRRDRFVAWMLSAAIMGGGGFLYAQFLGSFNPDTFYISVTFILIAMLVIGGLKSLSGAVTGVVVISVLSYILREVEGGAIGSTFARPGLLEVSLALIMLAILILRPQGLLGGREYRLPAGLKARFGRGTEVEVAGDSSAADGDSSGDNGTS